MIRNSLLAALCLLPAAHCAAVTPVLHDMRTATKVAKDYAIANVDFSLSYAPVAIASGSAMQSTVQDCILNTTTGIQQTGALVTVTPLASGATDSLTLSTPDTSVATVDNNGNVVPFIAGGNVRVVARGKITRTITVPTSVSSQTVVSFASYASGTAAKDGYDAVANRLAAMPSGAQNNLDATFDMWSLRDDANGAYRWNTASWFHDVDLTCISPWNSNQGKNKSGTAISPRHVIWATHYSLNVNDTIRFVGSDNATYTRTIMAISTVAGQDLSIGIMDSDLPAVVTPAKVLPTNFWTAYAPGAKYNALPVLWTNQNKLGYTGVIVAAASPGGSPILPASVVQINKPADATQLLYSSNTQSGDSGAPIGVILGSHFVLVGPWNSGGAGALIGTTHDTGYLATSVNTAMSATSTAVSAGTNYQLTVVDTTGYTSF